MTLEEYAQAEFDRLVPPDQKSDDFKDMEHDVLEILRVVSAQGHSAFSMPNLLRLLKRLIVFKPLSPLTGEDDEWFPPEDGGDGEMIQQNRRRFSVFRVAGDNRTAYDLHGKAFSTDGGQTYFEDCNSTVYVTFPYYPPDEPEKIVIGKNDKKWVL